MQTSKPANQQFHKILVGLSGGVDSAVSAYLLKEQGYEVACGFMINYLEDDSPQSPTSPLTERGKGGECTTLRDLEEAKKVAEYLELPLYTFDYRDEYDRRIVDYIYREYEAGRTPNPDVFCNNLVKFDLFLEEALALGYDAIATGHYARISPPNPPEKGGSSPVSVANRGVLFGESEGVTQNQKPTPPNLPLSGEEGYCLLKGLDNTKDQSYFLSRLTPFQLSRAMFPIGGLLKSEVREIAKKAGLPNADRKDSQGLCFIGKIPMKEFLARKLEKKEGNILSTDGKILGKHEGAFAYTIGQRKGIKVGGGPALFVVAKDTVANTITVGTESELELFSSSCTLTDWVGELPVEGKTYTAKIRYRQEDQEIMVNGEWSMMNSETAKQFTIHNSQFTIYFKKAQRAIASGQICVVYDGERVVGSGVIY